MTIADRMDAEKSGTVAAGYEVQLPSSADPVTYSVEAVYTMAVADTLAPCRYLVDWTLTRNGEELKGFNAYFDGNHYRFRDVKLQEYHVADDPSPFGGVKGVQNTAQFCELLPPYMAEYFRTMAADSTYSYKISTDKDGKSSGNIIIEGVRRIKGYDALEFRYVLDAISCMPMSAELDYNPASISEQNISIEYDVKPGGVGDIFSEQALLSRYPDIFSRYRQGNFAANNLKGSYLPAFEAVTPTRERYSRRTRDKFERPTVILFVNPEISTCGETIAEVRKAMEQTPADCALIIAVTSNDADLVEETAGKPTTEAQVLMSARAMARNCGVSEFPTLLFCNSDATVAEVQTGYNKNIASDVLQKTLQLK